MTRFGHKLRPPDVPLDDDIRWVLLAAFADRYPSDACPASPERAVRLVRQFSLVNAIASRLSSEQLARALTPALQAEISEDARRRVMHSLAVVQARELVCRAATEAAVDIVMLKQAALEMMGLVTPGQRYAADVDVLLRVEDVTRIAESLLRSGFVRERWKTHVNGVVVLRTTDDIGVELHTQIIGIRLGEDNSVADLVSLKDRGLIAQSDERAPRTWAPSLALLGAQLVAQGWYLFHFVPNGPQHKSPIRVIVDLGLLGAHRSDELASEIYGFVKHEIPANEFFGLVKLVGWLSVGNLEDLPEGVCVVFNHAIAAVLDEEYRYSLLLNRQCDAIRREGSLAWARRQFTRIFAPNQQDLERRVGSGEAGSLSTARMRIAGRSQRGLFAGFGLV